MTTHPGLLADRSIFDNDKDLQREFVMGNAGKYPRARYCDEVGHAIIDKVDLVIGGTLIDSHPGHYLNVWNELTQTPEKKQIGHLIGRSGSEAELEEMAQTDQDLYIPLQFFFCRHLMCSLPLIALQYHQVEIKVTFKQIDDVVSFWGYEYSSDTEATQKALQDGTFNFQSATGSTALSYLKHTQPANSKISLNANYYGQLTNDSGMKVGIYEGQVHTQGDVVQKEVWKVGDDPTQPLDATDASAGYVQVAIMELKPYTLLEDDIQPFESFIQSGDVNFQSVAFGLATKRAKPTNANVDYALKDVKLLCNLVYLEEEERKTFAGSTHEYLVDLLQYQGPMPCNANQTTTYHAYFNHPTTELIWCFSPEVCRMSSMKEPFNYTALQSSYNAAGDPLKEARLQFNGYDRFPKMKAAYFREIVPAQYHTSVPARNIYVYSFALEPEDFRPSGSVNLSRIDNVKLILDHVNFEPTITAMPGSIDSVTGELIPKTQDGFTTSYSSSNQTSVATHPHGQAGLGLFLHGPDGWASDIHKGAELRVYARSKNVLRIKSGMAGLAYAN